MDPDLLNKARFNRSAYSSSTMRQRRVSTRKVVKPVVSTAPSHTVADRSVVKWLGIGATVLTLMFASLARDVLRKPTDAELGAYEASWNQNIDAMSLKCSGQGKRAPSKDVVTIFVNGENFGSLDCGNLERQSNVVLTQIRKQPFMPDIMLRTTGVGPKEQFLPPGNNVLSGPFHVTASLRHMVSAALRVVGWGKLERSPSL